MQKYHKISFEKIYKSAMIYISLPLIIFLCGYIKWYYALFCCVILCLVLSQISRNITNVHGSQKNFQVSSKTVIIVFIFSMIWSYLGGMNGYYYQSSDWDSRNAVFFDLIRYKWPVTYEINGAALVYYFGHWLPPAALAKLFQTITGSVETGRICGRFFLWIWSSIGLTIIILLIYFVVGAKSGKKQVTATFIFVFFSGLDFIGALIRGCTDYVLDPSILHLEWWCPGFQYTSIMACLFWVFNQAIIPWMITLCFIIDKDPQNYVFYCVLCIICGTLPCVGLGVLMIVKAAIFLIKEKKKKNIANAFRYVFSRQNILSILFLFPVVSLFMLSANTVTIALDNLNSEKALANYSNPLFEHFSERFMSQKIAYNYNQSASTVPDGVPSLGIGVKRDPLLLSLSGPFSKDYLNIKLAAFLAIEVGFYMLFVFLDHWKDPLFYTIGICFLFIPYVHVGKSHDFCMRASIPAFFILMIYVTRFLLNHFPREYNYGSADNKKLTIRNISAVFLLVCFMIGTATPIVELYRGVYNVVENKSIFLENQDIMTFNREHIYNNFLCSDPDSHIFFQVFAR